MKIDYTNLKTTLTTVLESVPEKTPPLEALIVIPVYQTPTGAVAQPTGFLASGDIERKKLVILDTYLKGASELVAELLATAPKEQSRIVTG